MSDSRSVQNETTRYSRWFEAAVPQPDGSIKSIIGEALAYYQLINDHNQLVVICQLLSNLEQILGAWKRTWSSSLTVLKSTDIINKAFIWKMNTPNANIWGLRKHSGLAMLSATEVGEIESIGENEDSDSDSEDM